MDKAYIYGLVDPQNRKIHYVGHTISTASRLHEHIRDCADTPKTQWIATLADAGLCPELVVLDYVDYVDRFKEEYRWIYLGRERGWPLTNTIAMRTMDYTEIADFAESKIFIEIDKPVTWGMIGSIVVEFFTGDWLEDRYLYWRMDILNVSLFVMAIGTIMIGPGSVFLELPNTTSPWASYAIATGRVGMYVFFAGGLMMCTFALPLFVKRLVELLKYLWGIPRRYRARLNAMDGMRNT